MQPTSAGEVGKSHDTIVPYYASYSASSEAFTAGSTLAIVFEAPGYLYAVDYLSALLSFQGSFVQDPVYLLDFLCMGQTCEHVFLGSRVPSTVVDGYQNYVISQPVSFTADQSTVITFSGSGMPAGILATARLQLSGRLLQGACG